MTKPIYPFIEVEPEDMSTSGLVITEETSTVVTIRQMPTIPEDENPLLMNKGNRILVERVHEYLVDNNRVYFVHKGDIISVL